MIALVRGLFATARARAVVALIISVAVGLTEGLTLLLLIPLLRLAGVPFAGSMGTIDARVSSVLASVNVKPTLVSVLVIYILLTVAQATLTRARLMADARAVHQYSFSLRERLYRAIAKAEWLTLSRIRSSDFTYALTTAIDQVDSATQNILFFLATVLVAAVYAAVAFRVSPVMTAIVLGSSVLLIFFERARTLLGRTQGTRVATSTRELFATASEQLGGLKTAKSYGQEERHLGMFLDISRQVNATRIELTRTFAGLRWQMTVGSAIALTVILYLAVGVFHLPTAALLLLLFIFSRLVPRLLSLQQTYQEILSGLPALDAVEKLIGQCEKSPERATQERRPIPLEQSIELQSVSFAYDASRSESQLSNVSMMLPAGKTCAIAGPSGAGKTTVADMLLGLIKPSTGSVLIDGIPLDDSHLGDWRASIGYVAQDTFLFNDTVRANLLWASPDATESEMNRALEGAAASDFVARLPSGLDTIVGERGVRLSGGERQRLSLARALLRNPRLLVLDEPTSALDSENEAKIYRAIRELHGSLTIVIITHRLSTIRDADVIYLLDNGQVIASGTWPQMIETSQKFRDLCRAQGILS